MGCNHYKMNINLYKQKMKNQRMFWNKKEDEKPLPDLPSTTPLQTGFSLPNQPLALASTTVPSFPETPAIKHAVEDEFETISIKPITETRVREMPETRITSPSSIPTTVKTKAEEVFVKLDKFQSARKALNSAQDQVQDIASMLKRIRETKLREEQELMSWEKEVIAAKTKIEEINKALFDKL